MDAHRRELVRLTPAPADEKAAFSLSNTLMLATLPSGHRAVYDVQPQHLNLVGKVNLGQRVYTLNDVAVEHGT